MPYGTSGYGTSAYGISGVNSLNSSRTAFIVGQVGNISKSLNAYLAGVFIPATQLSYIGGALSAPSVSKNAYIYGAGQTIANKSSFINTINAQTAFKQSMVQSGMNITGSKPAYISVLTDTSGAIRFVGASQQYARFIADPHFSMNQFSIDVWVRIRTSYSTNDNYKPLWWWVNNASLYFDQDASHFFIDASFGGTYYRAAQSTQTLTALGGYNKWIKFTTTYDQATYKLYINGALATSIATSGGIAGTQPSDFYLGAQPSANRYTDTDMACFCVSNYAKTSTQIQNEFQPPHRLASLPAYISNIPASINNLSSLKNLFINTSGLVASRSSYIVAGGEAVKNFDTKIIINPPTTYNATTEFDTVIRFSAGPKVVKKYSGPFISYPITRQIIYTLPIHSTDDPGQLFATQNSYLHAGFTTTPATKFAYINVSKPAITTTQAYIQASFNAINIAIKSAYINGTMYSYGSISSYIVANLATTRSSMQQAYIAGTATSSLASKQSFVSGLGSLSATKNCYILTSNPIMSYLNGFVNAVPITVVQASRNLYIINTRSRSNSLSSFIYGVYITQSTRQAYIPVINFVSSSKACVIQYSIAAPTNYKLSYIWGLANVTGSKSNFLMATLNLAGSKSAFIAGNQHVPDGNSLAYINGATYYTNLLSANKSLFLYGAGTLVTSTKASFINSQIGTPSSSKNAYIINFLATSTGSKNSFMVAQAGPTNGYKPSYIQVANNLSASKNAYVNTYSPGNLAVSKSSYVISTTVLTNSVNTYMAGLSSLTASKLVYIYDLGNRISTQYSFILCIAGTITASSNGYINA